MNFYIKISTTLLVIALAVMSCNNGDSNKNRDNNNPENTINAKIAKEAGDQIIAGGKTSKTPFMFNMGNYLIEEEKSIESIIISNKISQGKNIEIRPIGFFSFKMDEKLQEYLISVPEDTTFNSLKIFSFFDLTTDHFQTKNMIEDWFRSNCTLGSCSDFQWGGELKAFHMIDKRAED